MSLSEVILQEAAKLAEGGSLTARLFLHLASRAAVDQALSRLAKQGKLMRVARGSYVAPVIGRFGPRPPSVEKTVQALAEVRGETIASHGAASANILGLTTQVPVREVFLTSGRSRQLHLGSRVVELRHAPHWQLSFEGTVGNAVRSLAWLGPEHARENVLRIRKRVAEAEWKSLTAARARLPGWMAEAVGHADAHA